MPATAAIRVLRAAGIVYTEHPYDYEEKGDAVSARELGVDEHAVVKTLVMEDDRKRPLIVLMHGDREVSTKELARAIAQGAWRHAPRRRHRHSGYIVGGSRRWDEAPRCRSTWRNDLDLPKIYINGGAAGSLWDESGGRRADPADDPVRVAI